MLLLLSLLALLYIVLTCHRSFSRLGHRSSGDPPVCRGLMKSFGLLRHGEAYQGRCAVNGEHGHVSLGGPSREVASICRVCVDFLECHTKAKQQAPWLCPDIFSSRSMVANLVPILLNKDISWIRSTLRFRGALARVLGVIQWDQEMNT
jgi:hypothetical protein